MYKEQGGPMCGRMEWLTGGNNHQTFFLAQTKMSWRSLLTSQYSTQTVKREQIHANHGLSAPSTCTPTLVLSWHHAQCPDASLPGLNQCCLPAPQGLLAPRAKPRAHGVMWNKIMGKGHSLVPWGCFRTAWAQCGHSANYYGDYPGNNPENHPLAESCTINSKLKNSNI